MAGVPRLTILDVGHGNGAVLQDTEGVVVIDAGQKNTMLEFLLQEGIQRIDVVIVSHADQDHLGGLLALIASRSVEIGRVRLNTDSLKGSAIWDDLLSELDSLHELGMIDFEPSLTADDSGVYDQGSVRIELLAPSRYLAAKGPGSSDRNGRTITTNTISAVIRLVHGGKPIVLLPGDLDQVGFDNLLLSGRAATASILVFPHHGGGTGATGKGEFATQLCNLVQPSMVVFSIGRNKFANPRPEVVEAIRRSGRRIWVACTQLSRHCAGDLPRDRPNHLADVFADGKQSNRCCSGSIVVDLSGSPQATLPLYAGHQEFISINAPTALCRQQIAGEDLQTPVAHHQLFEETAGDERPPRSADVLENAPTSSAQM